MDYFTITADAPGVNMYVYDEGIAENAKVENFNLLWMNQGGLYNEFFICNIHEMFGAAGSYANCAIYGPHEDNNIHYNHKFRVQENTTLISCYPGEAGSPPTIWMTNTGGTELSIRDWNGDITIDKVESENDRIVLEVVAGKITLTSGCTNGIIDIRGVGYMENNVGTGCTIITTGFVDSFKTYIEETQATDQRLSYSDRIYYDETSIYTGTTYPVGTIAKPVNNAFDAVNIAYSYGINKFLVLSDITLSGITGQYFQNFQITGIKENLTANLNYNDPLHNYFNNILWENFIITGLLSGGTNTISNCEIVYLETFKGILKNSKLIGDMTIHGDTDIINCYSGDLISTEERETPNIYLENTKQTSGITLDFRNYSGDLKFSKVQDDNDYVVVDINSGKIELTSGCTAGYIEIRGVGSLVNNSGSGCTINYDGFVNSFQVYLEQSQEIDQQLAYNNKIYIDQISGFTGSNYPVGTIVQPAKNPPDIFTLSAKYSITNWVIVEDFVAVTTGLTFDGISFIGGKENLKLTSPGNTFNNCQFINLMLDVNFVYGTNNKVTDCVIINVLNFNGIIENSQLGTPEEQSTMSIHDYLILNNCHSGNVGGFLSRTPIFDMGVGIDSYLAVRNYSGGVDIRNLDTPDSKATIDLTGQAKFHETCTDGFIDLRGVGYYLDNSSGTTIKTDGFVNSFGTYIEATQATDQILAYGGRIYLDGINGFTGTTYPVGTIAKPVNNLPDLITLSNNLNIRDLYLLSSFVAQDASGNTVGIPQDFIGYNNFAANIGLQLTLNSDEPGIIDNSKLNGFYIYNVDYSGRTVTIENSTVENFYNLHGEIVQSSLNGDLTIYGDLTTSYCFSGDENNPPTIKLVNPSGSNVSFRNYSGYIIIDEISSDNDIISLDVVAAKIIINSGCTNGTIDLRGVGYLEDNSSGTTVITTGFVDSFESYIEETRETDQRLSYSNQLFIDQLNGSTGSTYPIGTQANPVNNIVDLFTLSVELNIQNIRVKEQLELFGLPVRADNFNAYSDTPYVPLWVDRTSGNNLYNVSINNFDIIEGYFQGHEHSFYKCILRSIHGLTGHLVECDLDGDSNILDPYYVSGVTYIGVYGNTTFAGCHPRHADDHPKIKLVNPSGTTCAFRAWSGDLELSSMVHDNDKIIVEMIAGKVTLTSGCTSGLVEIRGVGEVIDNSLSGCTIKRDGQLQATPGEYDKEIVIDVINGSEGTIYPIGTNSYPVNNITDALTLLDNYDL